MNIKNRFKNQIIALALLTSVSILFTNCKKDSLDEAQMEATQTSILPEGYTSEAVAADGITSDSYYLVNSLPSGYVKDGSKDYTLYIQAAVTKYSNIVFPGFPILVNDAGINIGSNKTITFQEGSELRLKPSSKEGYSILSIVAATNVTLYNPVIIGDRASHIGTKGEWGMGISIKGSSNISVHNSKITDCWGDGIYLGQANSTNCKNIVLKDTYLRNNRRDGLTIVGIDGLLVENMYAGFTAGTQPASGVNFEPNNAKAELKNIVFTNLVTESNGERGIQFGGPHMLNSSNNKTIDITFINHIDKNSPFSSFKFSCFNIDGTSAKMFGTIKFVNPSWQRTANNRPLHIMTDQANVKIEISSPQIITASGVDMLWANLFTFLTKINKIVTVTNDLPQGIVAVPAPDQIPSTDSTNNPEPAPAPSISVGTVVFAVNAGGSLFKASNGITYSADKNYVGGKIYKTSNAIANTSDDVLYQSERFGNSSYNIPLANGTYEVTFKMSELYHKSSGKRRFDILAENSEIVSNLDVFAVAGLNNSFDIVKAVTVTDGSLNLTFRTDVNNAKVSAFHVIKK